jgi:hypothetical protein
MMNLGGKQDLDALLAGWSAPSPWKGADLTEQDDEQRWEARAGAVVQAALAFKASSGEVDDALLAAPALAPEPGEPADVPGEKKMSQENEPAEAAPVASAVSTSTPPPAEVAPPTERRRTSLKEIAARASQSGARAPSASAGAASSATSSPLPRPSTRPPSATPLPRPVEAGKDDSGVINLDVVRKATAQQVADAEKAKPAAAGLFEDDQTVESPVNPAEKPAPARVAKVAVIESRRKDRTGMIAGGVIAVLGLAAAVALMTRKPPAPPPAAMTDTRPAPTVMAPAAPEIKATAAPVATADPAPSATAEADSKPGDVPRGVVAAAPGPAASPGAVAPSPTGAVAAAPGKPAGTSGDLRSEMARAVGKDGTQPDPGGGPTPQPAAGLPNNQNIPEAPSQGAVQSAVSAVMGGAKGCVAGADDVSRANVTFSSNGAVTSVSVTGWAAAHGQSGCIQAALKSAKVGAFSRSSFTFPVTIRP